MSTDLLPDSVLALRDRYLAAREAYQGPSQRVDEHHRRQENLPPSLRAEYQAVEDEWFAAHRALRNGLYDHPLARGLPVREAHHQAGIDLGDLGPEP